MNLVHLIVVIAIIEITVVKCDVLDQESTGVRSGDLEERDVSVSGEEQEFRKKKEKQDMMSKILPMMVMPFMVSTSMIPMMLMSMKFMLMKSALMGGIAIILLLINMLRGRSDQGGVYSHNFHQHRDLAMAHYGYGGDEEYGAYINRRSFR